MPSLEDTIRAGQRGDLSLATVVKVFVSSQVIVPTGSIPADDGSGLTPLIFDRDGVPMVAVFTDLKHAEIHSHLAPYALSVVAEWLLRVLRPGTGVVINPGHDVGLELPPESVAAILAEFGKGT